MQRRDLLKFAGAGVLAGAPIAASSEENAVPSSAPGWLNVREFGARGDGIALDSLAINRAIETVANRGGGTVYFPAGIYLCYSIRLKSHVGLHLDHGATLLAAPSPLAPGTTSAYDAAEPQGAWEPYQDYGHNHWHNSLIWGEGLEDISITGRGLIWGKGLTRGWDGEPGRADTRLPGVGNKAIAMKRCRNVLIRDLSILEGGWFAILATGVDNFTLDNLTIDTNRDGIDLDCCRNVHVSNCTVNSPWDDGICPKSSYALGETRATEDVTIANCYVTGGYQLGSVIDGSWKPLSTGPETFCTGRIKLGTESNGGFRNIVITNCVFESSQGFALESEDGAVIENISFTNTVMRDIRRSGAFFLRLGARMRGPKDAKPGTMRQVRISGITCESSSLLPAIISGVPGHPIEDVSISDCRFHLAGGATAEMAALDPPEMEAAYPDPTMFGDLPAAGLLARHVRGLDLSNVSFFTGVQDPRPCLWLKDVDDADFFRLRMRHSPGPAFDLRQVRGFRSFGSPGLQDVSLAEANARTIPTSKE